MKDLVGGSQRVEQRLDRCEAGIGRFDPGGKVGFEFVVGEEDFPLVGEVAVEGALGQAGGARDLRDRGALEPLRLEEFERRALEPPLCV